MNFLKFTVFAFAGLIISSVASAQISGTFFAAQDGVNTFRVDNGLTFSDSQSVGDLWDDASGQGNPADPFFSNILAIDGFVGPSGGYQATDGSEADIVTTIDNLIAGQEYQVDVIYSSFFGFGGLTPAGLAAGLTQGTVTGVDTSLSVDTGLAPINNLDFAAIFQQGLGTATANVDGEIEVFLDGVNGASSFLVGYNGVAVTPVPEPSSLALLACCGGLALARRRRR